MKKILLVTLILVFTFVLTSCGFIGNEIISDGEVSENDNSNVWIEDNVEQISYEIKESWDYYDMGFDEEDPEYSAIEYDVRGKDGDLIFTMGVYCEYGKKAMDIAADDDYGEEEGITIEDYKYKAWEQGEFKGCADSWTTKYTDEKVDEFENEYYEGLTINDNTSYGKGVMFDYGGNAYIVNYELYSDKKADKTKANSYLDKIIKSLKVYDGSDEDERDETTEV